MERENDSKKNFEYLITIAYDGTDFFGWAKQPGKFTAQGYIEENLKKVFNRDIFIGFWSRLDKGVHALDQKFFFVLPFFLSLESLLVLLKKKLKLLWIRKAEQKKFLKVKQKEYRYFLSTASFNFWKLKYRWEYNRSLELEKLRELVNLFLGKHDFFNFCFVKEKDKLSVNSVRELNFFQVVQRKKLFVFIIKAKGFLRYQIRAIIGEIIKCYEGKKEENDLKKRLENHFSAKYSFLAPASGLYLWKLTLI